MQTTAVGVYRHGASPCGALDLAGNVLEWCLNKYEDQRDSDTDGKAARVLRGGSWNSIQVDARSASRDRFGPNDRFNTVGFRVLCSSPIFGP